MSPVIETTRTARTAGARSAPLAAEHEPTRDGGLAAVVVNPAKFRSTAEFNRFRADVVESLAARGWLPPLWLPTTAETLGADEARWAKAAGVDVVLVAGGDGTVRTVAQQLVGSAVALGVVPMGTGNLLARNLGIPVGDTAAAVAVALGDRSRRIDVGWLQLDPVEDETAISGGPAEHAFLVMAGAGFDAAMMAGAGHRLKARLGRLAYVVSGGRALASKMVVSEVSVDGVATVTGSSRGFVVGNFGRLSMGLTLMPDADPADGLLDAVVLKPRGVLDWLRLSASITTGRSTARLMPRLRGRAVAFRADTPVPVEVDGDVVGEARLVRARIERAALLVRA